MIQHHEATRDLGQRFDRTPGGESHRLFPGARTHAAETASDGAWSALADWFGLTGQELEFTRLIVACGNSAEAADLVNLSPMEAGRFLASIREKLLIHACDGFIIALVTQFLRFHEEHLALLAARPPAVEVPEWDGRRRELWFTGIRVKWFRKAAPVQQRILDSFDELGWTWRIDDPLPPRPGKASSRRLHNAVGRLNRSLDEPLIHFGCDGWGQGVCWRPVKRRGLHAG